MITLVGSYAYKLVKLLNVVTCFLLVLTCMGSCVPLQIKCVVETLATECAEVPLGVAVTLHVPVQQPLEGESFATRATRELARV